MAFRDNLRRLRLQHFWTQAELAERSGIGRVTIANLERGAQSPSLGTVSALARALGVKRSELAEPSETAQGKGAA